MVDWNRFMSEAMTNLIPSEKQRKKNFFDACKKTPSEKMQDELEPISYPCPMHEDYDDEKNNV